MATGPGICACCGSTCPHCAGVLMLDAGPLGIYLRCQLELRYRPIGLDTLEGITMQSSTFTLEAADGSVCTRIVGCPKSALRATVQIVHGWAEHAARYARLAEAFANMASPSSQRYRGHGHTARSRPN